MMNYDTPPSSVLPELIARLHDRHEDVSLEGHFNSLQGLLHTTERLTALIRNFSDATSDDGYIPQVAHLHLHSYAHKATAALSDSERTCLLLMLVYGMAYPSTMLSAHVHPDGPPRRLPLNFDDALRRNHGED